MKRNAIPALIPIATLIVIVPAGLTQDFGVGKKRPRPIIAAGIRTIRAVPRELRGHAWREP